MDPVKKLAEMLEEAGIPFEYNVEKYKEPYPYKSVFGQCEADAYSLNQVLYGRFEDIYHWKLDAIWQRGSYGRHGHLLEVYGEMIGPEPRTLTTDEVFKMIEADWKKQ